MKWIEPGSKMLRLYGLLVGIRDLLISVPVLLVFAPLRVLPAAVSSRVGRFYGYCGFVCWGAGRRAGMINLRRAYGPSMKLDQARRWIWQVFGNLGESLAEAAQFTRRYQGTDPSWEAEYEPEDADLQERMLGDPRAKIFVTGHLGSWEITMLMLSIRTGGRGAAVARRVDNPFLNWFVRRARTRYGSVWIEKRGAADRCQEWIESGGSVAMVMDENGGWRGIHVDFFGRPASTSRMAALLALTTQAPVVLGAALRRAGRPFLYRLAVLEPRDYAAAPDPVWKMTQDIAAIQETWIREDPLQWRWIHWRWKTRPGGAEESYTRRDLRACFGPDKGGEARAATHAAG